MASNIFDDLIKIQNGYELAVQQGHFAQASKYHNQHIILQNQLQGQYNAQMQGQCNAQTQHQYYQQPWYGKDDVYPKFQKTSDKVWVALDLDAMIEAINSGARFKAERNQQSLPGYYKLIQLTFETDADEAMFIMQVTP